MDLVKKGLKEWNAVVEALGTGKQSVIVRTYSTPSDSFLLYPTFTYSRSADYLNLFKKKDWDFVKKNLIPNKISKKVEIKYLATVEKIIKISPNQTKKYDNYHIWTKNHIKSYIKGKNSYLWVLRVYKLKKPYFADPNRSILYVNFKKEINVEGAKPVISENDFNKLLEELI